jgi:hypothetical protein
MYIGKKSSKQPRTLGQKMAGAVYSLGTRIAPAVLSSVVTKALPKLLM